VEFEGRQVYPIRFLLKHYPIRSQAHGQHKVLTERKGRFDPEERARGWHVHYDHVDTQTSFIVDPTRLERYDSIKTKQFLLKHPIQPDSNVSFD